MITVRTVSDTKRDFYRAYPKPIISVYRRVIDELLVELHLLVVNQTFCYDKIFALGVFTAFQRFMADYQSESDASHIFAAMCQSLSLDQTKLTQDATYIQDLAQKFPQAILSLFNTLESSSDAQLDELMGQVRAIASNEKFKYSRLFAIGLYTLLEIADAENFADPTKRKEVLIAIGNTLNIGGDRLTRDTDLYLANLEKIQQGKQMMADLAEAERKKREKKESTSIPAAVELEPKIESKLETK